MAIEVTLLDHTHDPLKTLYTAFRVCYSSLTPGQIEARIADGRISREQMQEFIDARRQPLVHVREAEQPGAKESGTDHEAGTALQQHGDRSQAFGVQTETDDSVPCEGGNPPEEGQNDETPHVLAAA